MAEGDILETTKDIHEIQQEKEGRIQEWLENSDANFGLGFCFLLLCPFVLIFRPVMISFVCWGGEALVFFSIRRELLPKGVDVTSKSLGNAARGSSDGSSP